MHQHARSGRIPGCKRVGKRKAAKVCCAPNGRRSPLYGGASGRLRLPITARAIGALGSDSLGHNIITNSRFTADPPYLKLPYSSCGPDRLADARELILAVRSSGCDHLFKFEQVRLRTYLAGSEADPRSLRPGLAMNVRWYSFSGPSCPDWPPRSHAAPLPGCILNSHNNGANKLTTPVRVLLVMSESRCTSSLRRGGKHGCAAVRSGDSSGDCEWRC